MNVRHRAIMTAVVLVMPWMCACTRHETIPRLELNEIRKLAFDNATQKYVLSDASIESQYEENLHNHPKTNEMVKRKPAVNEPVFDFEALGWELHSRVPAIASIKGVQLNPSTPKVCLIKFDFELSHNPHARLPENEATAEKFERSDGSHYWVIVCK